MKTLKTISLVIIIFIVGAAVVFRSLTIYIPMGKVGVRIQQFGVFGKKGLVEKDFGPGWHRDLGPIDRWEIFDSTVQTLEMTRQPGEGSRTGADDIKIQSADGYAISLDVTVKYRIATNMAYKVYQDTGSRDRYKVIVRNEAEQACMGMFGQMETEDFYNPTARRETTATVHSNVSEALVDNSIEVIAVLVRDVQFDPEYEKKILMKKLADQEVELHKSEAKAAEERGKTEVIKAETEKLVKLVERKKEAELIGMKAQTDLEIAKINAEAARDVTQMKADADRIVALKRADGERKIKKAEAEGERLRNAALAGAGGSTMAALEAARNLNFKDVTLSTLDIDILDINAMSEKLGAKENK